jgi:menaquinone-dependent protoporphyrinogen oxidase
MKTVIIYATQHGTTEKVAKRIAKSLGDTQVIALKYAKKIDLSSYETIILGSSIHAGRNQNSMQQFCRKHLPELLQKRVSLFLSCLNPKEFEQSKERAYPELLRKHAIVYELTGGEYLIEKMNFIERFLVKKMVGVTVSKSLLNEEGIDRLIVNNRH